MVGRALYYVGVEYLTKNTNPVTGLKKVILSLYPRLGLTPI